MLLKRNIFQLEGLKYTHIFWKTAWKTDILAKRQSVYSTSENNKISVVIETVKNVNKIWCIKNTKGQFEK